MEGVSESLLIEIAGEVPNDRLYHLAPELKIPFGEAERYQKTNASYGEVSSQGTLKMLRTWKENTKKEDQQAQLKRALEKAKLGGIAHQHFGHLNHMNVSRRGLALPLSAVSPLSLFALKCHLETQYIDRERISRDYIGELAFPPKLTLPDEQGRQISRHHIFSRSGVNKHRRRIVVSGGSDAKNTALSHILAYDWATQNQASPLSKEQLVFELRAGLFSENQTIEGAIKQQLFRGVDKVDEKLIRQILDVMPNAVTVLVDGFDENRIVDYGDNIMKILEGRALQEVTVMVTAKPRSASLFDILVEGVYDHIEMH